VRIRNALLALSCGLSACQNLPDAYAPPEQRPRFDTSAPRATRIVEMSDPDAPFHFVRDISPTLMANWRWTGQRPAVKVRVRDLEPFVYSVDFTLPDITMHDTGPVTIAFLVNDRVLDRVHYEKPGYQHFEKPVPAGVLAANQDAILGAEIDKMWSAPQDGAKFGFILTRVGLVRASPDKGTAR
jgi:hypothetical protein